MILKSDDDKWEEPHRAASRKENQTNIKKKNDDPLSSADVRDESRRWQLEAIADTRQSIESFSHRSDCCWEGGREGWMEGGS